MSYNKEKDVSAGYISPAHQKQLHALKTAHKRSKREELEVMIEDNYKELKKVVDK